MQTKFNIYSQVAGELQEFFTKKISIGGTSNSKKVGYEFSQADTLNLIQYVGGSRFEKGDKDSEGQQKIYLNSSVFRADVASKQIDIDVANIKFIPAELQDKNICLLKRREFKRWSKDEGFGVEINEMVEKFPFWGTLVAKKRGKEYDLIPLTKLRNQQDAKSLKEASYVIIEHEMEAWEAQAMPDWDLSGLEYSWDEKLTVYERYGRVPATFFDPKAPETESVDTVSFVVLDKKNKTKEGCLLFIEKIKERPFIECHWKQIEGRWLGIGEIENNFDNQKARNAVFNLRLRSMLWSSKNLFQSTDETVAKNLIREVRDGDVITVTDTGITPINTQTKSIADFNTLDDIIEKNSDQKSFTYEVATGESLPSGTPFRLGVVLANSTNNHFGLKREKLSLFIKELLYDFILPAFEKDTRREHKVALASGEEGYNDLVEIYSGIKENEFIYKYIMANGVVPSPVALEKFRSEMKKDFEIVVEEGQYELIENSIDIEITGEAVDIEGKMATLTTLYQVLSQRQDPRADQVLEKILLLSDEELPKGQTGQQTQPLNQMVNMAQMSAQPNAATAQ